MIGDADTLPEVGRCCEAIDGAARTCRVHLPVHRVPLARARRHRPVRRPASPLDDCDFELVRGACSGVYVTTPATWCEPRRAGRALPRLGLRGRRLVPRAHDPARRAARAPRRARLCAAPHRPRCGRAPSTTPTPPSWSSYRDGVRRTRGDGASCSCPSAPERAARSARPGSPERARAPTTAGRATRAPEQVAATRSRAPHASSATVGRVRVQGASPKPARSSAAAPANWSVENGSTSSGTPAVDRLGDAVVAAVRDRRGRVAGAGAPAAGTPAPASRPGSSPSSAPGRPSRVAIAARTPSRAQRRDHAGQHVAAHREEAAEADVDERLVDAASQRLDLGVDRLVAHGRAEERVRRQQRRRGRVGELGGVVVEQQVAVLGERVARRSAPRGRAPASAAFHSRREASR